MKEILYSDGFTIHIEDDNTASAKLNHAYSSDEVFIPFVVNEIPVTSFSFNEGNVGQRIKRIVIPASVKMLDFPECRFDHNIELAVDDRNPFLYSDGCALYSKDRSELICFSARGDEEYKIIDGCKTVRADAFNSSGNLKRILFPEGLNTIGEGAFTNCDGLTELILPDGLAEIKAEAFKDCNRIKKITLPPTLKIISKWAFFGNPNTLEICLPESLEDLGFNAFPDNWRLTVSEKSINLSEKDGFILSENGKNIMRLSQPHNDSVLVIPDYVTKIGSCAFAYIRQIEKVILPPGLHTIKDLAFYENDLKEIDLENVKIIEDGAFANCASLEKIRLKCDELGIRAFNNCSSLTEAEIDCKELGEEAFGKCEALRRVILKNTRVIGKLAFFHTPELKEIIFPPELESIKENTFAFSGSPLFIPKTVKRLEGFSVNGVREIHVFDNIETEISVDNDISKYGYTLFVHSAQTGEIKYAVPIIGKRYGFESPHNELVEMFKGGTDFDFQKFDNFFCSLPDDPGYNIDVLDKFNAGIQRLKYGFELNEKTRREYERQLGKLVELAAPAYIECDEAEILMNRGFYTDMSIEDLIRVIELSTEHQQTELTAFLLQILQEKRQAGAALPPLTLD